MRLCDHQNAQVLFTRELRRRLAGTGIIATAVNPGFVASDIWRGFHAMPTVSMLWQLLCSALALTVEQGAATSVAAATGAVRLPPPHSATGPVVPSPGGGGGVEPTTEEPEYLQPYYVAAGWELPLELFGPFAGARPALPFLPPNEPAVSASLWRICEQLSTSEGHEQ